uniref:Uncharacterized protein n=1 Tax=Anguilla anguilla TaxID=7936 RepID=A0A0E9XBL7_ANGAN
MTFFIFLKGIFSYENTQIFFFVTCVSKSCECFFFKF